MSSEKQDKFQKFLDKEVEKPKNELENAPNDTFWERASLAMRLIIPASAGCLIGMITEILNLAFIGKLDNPAMFAGVGVGNMTQNICAMSLVIGFNSALDTLIS